MFPISLLDRFTPVLTVLDEGKQSDSERPEVDVDLSTTETVLSTKVIKAMNRPYK